MKFKPPTTEEVKAYAYSIGYKTLDPNKWWHFYNSKNWMIGKSKMTSWKSAVWTWFTGTYEYREMKRRKQATQESDNRLREQYGEYIRTASEIKIKEMRKAPELEHIWWLIDEIRGKL